MIEVIFFISFILLIWFETGAFVEYSMLASHKYPIILDKLFLKDYETLTDATPMSYPEFLVEYHNSFFTRLLSCPICMSTQLGLFFSLFIGISKFGILALGGLLLYSLIKRVIS